MVSGGRVFPFLAPNHACSDNTGGGICCGRCSTEIMRIIFFFPFRTELVTCTTLSASRPDMAQALHLFRTIFFQLRCKALNCVASHCIYTIYFLSTVASRRALRQTIYIFNGWMYIDLFFFLFSLLDFCTLIPCMSCHVRYVQCTLIWLMGTCTRPILPFEVGWDVG